MRPEDDIATDLDDDIRTFLGHEALRVRTGARGPQSVIDAIRRIHKPPTRTTQPQLWTGSMIGAGLLAVVLVLGLVAFVLPRPDSAGSRQSASGSGPTASLRASEDSPSVCSWTAAGSGSPHLAPLPGSGAVRPLWAWQDGVAYFEATPGGDWQSIDATWVAAPGYEGRAVVTGRRLDTIGELRFGDPADPMRSLDLSAETATTLTPDGWIGLGHVPIRVREPGCYSLTVADSASSSTITFEAKPVADATANLRQRTLNTANMTTAPCPVTKPTVQSSFVGPLAGGSHVFIGGLSSGGSLAPGVIDPATGMRQIRTFWVASPIEPGPILLRRADSTGDLRFETPTGATVDAVLPIHSYASAPGQPPAWRQFDVGVLVEDSGCYAIQVDGLNSVTMIVFEVLP